MHCPRAPTLETSKGLRPQNRHSQKRKVKRSWCLVSNLSWLARLWFLSRARVSGSFFWSLRVSVCFFFLLLFLSIGRGRHVPAPGWEGRRVKRTGTDSRTGGGRRPKNPLFQVSLYARLSCAPRHACLVLCLPVCYSISPCHDWSHDGHREAFRLLMTGYFSRLHCPGELFVLRLCKTAKCRSFVCYRFECTFQVLVFQFKREHAVGRRSDDFRSCFRIPGSTADTRAHTSVHGFWKISRYST